MLLPQNIWFLDDDAMSCETAVRALSEMGRLPLPFECAPTLLGERKHQIKIQPVVPVNWSNLLSPFVIIEDTS